MADENNNGEGASGITFGNGAMAFGDGAMAFDNGADGGIGRKFVDLPNPLDKAVLTGNAEEDAEAELDALQLAYRERNAKENDRFLAATDSEFWIALCFLSREDKEAFLKKYRIIHLGDKYLDGHAVDDVLTRNAERNDRT